MIYLPEAAEDSLGEQIHSQRCDKQHTRHGKKTCEHGGTLRGIPLNATEAERKTFAAGHGSMRQGWGRTLDQLAGYLAQA